MSRALTRREAVAVALWGVDFHPPDVHRIAAHVVKNMPADWIITSRQELIDAFIELGSETPEDTADWFIREILR